MLCVDIPDEETINSLFVYPEPPFNILMSDIVFLNDAVENLWIPAVLDPLKDTVLIPDK